MTINSIYLFLENHGNILRDYYLNNTLTYSNTITDEWVYDSNLNRISFKFKPNSINYFHKSLTENYNESFSIFFHLKIDNLSLYQDENTDYFIFDSINPDGSNQLKSFAIVLQKISNKYFYKLKIDNLNNGNQYLDIYEIDNSINNINQYICIVCHAPSALVGVKSGGLNSTLTSSHATPWKKILKGHMPLKNE